MNRPADLDDWRARLQAAGLLIETGTDGLWARGAVFEGIAEAVAGLVRRLGADQDPVVVRFPPLVSAGTLSSSGFLRSFPDLAGVVHCFAGDERGHARLLRLVAQEGSWATGLAPAGLALCSSACHPLYPTIAGTLPPGGGHWDVYGTVFRHEPSRDPARMQSFRQYEIVYVGQPRAAADHRDTWRERSLDLLGTLGLDPVAEAAHDPFFGRAGRMLAEGQEAGGLKHEVLGQAGPGDQLTALASSNYHLSHFGEAFGIRCADGEVAHSACVGFGIERIVLALLWHHGLDPYRWPRAAHRSLWP